MREEFMSPKKKNYLLKENENDQSQNEYIQSKAIGFLFWTKLTPR